jgi:hypothetical protein
VPIFLLPKVYGPVREVYLYALFIEPLEYPLTELVLYEVLINELGYLNVWISSARPGNTSTYIT